MSDMRLLAIVLLMLTLSACADVQTQLDNQANPSHHPFHSYGASG